MCCVLTYKITLSSHLSIFFYIVFQTYSYDYPLSSQDKSHSDICVPTLTNTGK